MLKDIKTLLIAVDLKSDNSAFFQRTIKFINFLGASVILLHVEEDLPLYSYFQDLDSESEENVEEQLQDAVKKFSDSNVTVINSICEKGRPYSVICEMADKLDVDAVVISAGENFKEKKLLGSTADKVIRMSNKNVVLMNQFQEKYSNTVICAYDFSPSSESAFKLSKEFADVSQRSLTVLHVINKVYFSSTVQASNSRIDHFAKIEKIEAAAEKRLKESVTSLIDDTSGLEFLINQGIPAVQICSTVKKHNADWLFIGASGHNKFLQMLMGSTVEDVYRTATTNIFIIKNINGS